MKIIEKMAQQNIIPEENVELIQFGLRQCFHIMCNWGIVIALGLMFHMKIWQSLLFYFAFCIVRVFAGGYHSRTRAGCYICSMICIAVSFWIFHQFVINKAVCALLYAIAVGLIIYYSPMDNPNKKLSAVEAVRFKKILRGILLVYTLSFAVMMYFSLYSAYVLLLLAVVFVGIMILVGLLQKNMAYNK